MTLRYITFALSAMFTLLLILGCSSEQNANNDQADSDTHKKQYLAFGGGPTGGTFNFFANKMASLISEKNTWLEVSPKGPADQRRTCVP